MSLSTGYTNNLISQTPAGNNAQGITLNAFRRDRNYFGTANPDTIRQRARAGAQEQHRPADPRAPPSPRRRSRTFSSRFTIGFDRAAIENRNVRPYGFPAVPLGVIQDQRWQNTTLSTDWVNSYDFDARQRAQDHGVRRHAVRELARERRRGLQRELRDAGRPDGRERLAQERRREPAARHHRWRVRRRRSLGFKDRYFLTVGARMDGNSAFGEDFGFQTYPKVSGVVGDQRGGVLGAGVRQPQAARGLRRRRPRARRLRRRADLEPGRLGRPARRSSEQLRQRRPRPGADDGARARLRRERARRPPQRRLHVVQRHDHRRAVQRALHPDERLPEQRARRTSAR